MMNYKTLLIFAVFSLLLSACGEVVSADQHLQRAVNAAISSASDLPQSSLTITVNNAVVTVSGSIDCEDCGGMRTPGGTDTIQQSLGAVIAAVPGVSAVRFSLE